MKYGTKQFWSSSLARLSTDSDYPALTAILLLAMALRWWSPALMSDLWYDEIFSLAVAQQPFGQMMHLLTGAESNPPLYFVMLHFWLKLGDSDLHAQLFSLLFAPASVVAMYRLASLIGSRQVSLLACLLFAVSQSTINYSVEVRHYSLFLFLSILSTYYFLSIILRSDLESELLSRTLAVWAKYSIATTLVIYTHWFGLLLPLIHILGLVIYRRRQPNLYLQFVLSLLAVGVLCLPLILFLWGQVRLQESIGGFSWAEKPNWHSLVTVISFLAGGKNLAVLAVMIFLIVYLSNKRQRGGDKTFLRHVCFFGSYILMPLVTVGIGSQVLARYSLFVPRYFLPFTVGVCVLLSLSLLRVDKRIALFSIVLFIAYPVIKAIKHSKVPERPYSQIALELPCELRPGVLIAHLSPMSYNPVRHYRQGCSTTEKVLWIEDVGRGYILRRDVAGGLLDQSDSIELHSALRGFSDIWIIIDQVDQDPGLRLVCDQLKYGSSLNLESEKVFGLCLLQHYSVPQQIL